MKFFTWVIILLCWVSTAAAQSDGYSLGSAPWSNQDFEVCLLPNEDGLRAVIFEPEIAQWSYTQKGPATTELKATKNGITEVVVKSEKQFPAYHLKKQKIGYLNDHNRWVDKKGNKLLDFDSFRIVSGKKTQPKVKSSYEKFIYKANLELEHAAALEKMHYEAPCTVFAVGHFSKLEAEIGYDFGQNNPYQCDDDKGLKRSQKFNYVDKVSRPVVTMADGTSYYIKYPSGDIKTYGLTGFERLYNEDGSLICDWNDLGRLIGYELTSPN